MKQWGPPGGFFSLIKPEEDCYSKVEETRYRPWPDEDPGNTISDIPLSEKKLIDNDLNTTEEEEVIWEPPMRMKETKIPKLKKSVERKPLSYYHKRSENMPVSEKPTELP